MQQIASRLVYSVRLEQKHVTDSLKITLLTKNVDDLTLNEQSFKVAINLYDQTLAKQKERSDNKIANLTSKIKWLKFGWAATAMFLAGTTTYFLIKE